MWVNGFRACARGENQCSLSVVTSCLSWHRNTTNVIYAFLNQKGGVGKTTLSVHTAAEFARQCKRVLLIDAGPQGSGLAWANCRETPAFTVVGMPKATIHKEIHLLAKDYDEIVIDGPPQIAELARSILLAADLVVIPLLPSPLDVWAAAETVDLRSFVGERRRVA